MVTAYDRYLASRTMRCCGGFVGEHFDHCHVANTVRAFNARRSDGSGFSEGPVERSVGSDPDGTPPAVRVPTPPDFGTDLYHRICELPGVDDCPRCWGMGEIPAPVTHRRSADDTVCCPRCNGSGEITVGVA